jgi:hypothetical protein
MSTHETLPELPTRAAAMKNSAPYHLASEQRQIRRVALRDRGYTRAKRILVAHLISIAYGIALAIIDRSLPCYDLKPFKAIK